MIGQTALESVFTNQSTCTKLSLNEHYGLDFTYLIHDLHTASGNVKTLTRKKFTFYNVDYIVKAVCGIYSKHISADFRSLEEPFFQNY